MNIVQPPAASGFYWVSSAPDKPDQWQLAHWDAEQRLLATWLGECVTLLGLAVTYDESNFFLLKLLTAARR